MKLIETIDSGISLVNLENGERKFLCHGVLGEEATREFEEREKKDVPFDASFNGGQEIFRLYETKEAAEAYWNGVRDMDGYLGYTTSTFEEHMKAFPVNKTTSTKGIMKRTVPFRFGQKLTKGTEVEIRQTNKDSFMVLDPKQPTLECIVSKDAIELID